MKPTRVGDDWARFDDGTTWALPEDSNADACSLEWHLRYGTPAKREEQRFSVASVLASYKALVFLPQRERNARVKAIREAMAIRDERDGSKGGT